MGVKAVTTDASGDSLQAVSNNNNNHITDNLRNNDGNHNVRHSDAIPEYPVKTVEVKVCGPLYAELRDKKTLYRDVPEDGIDVKIEYADTIHTYDASGKEITRDSVTVLCLHGAPGSHRDFKYMIKHLQQTGHRVIVPNFPSKCPLLSRPQPLFPLEEEDESLSHLERGFRGFPLRTPDSLASVSCFSSHHSIQANDKDGAVPSLGAREEGVRQRIPHVDRRHEVSQTLSFPASREGICTPLVDGCSE